MKVADIKIGERYKNWTVLEDLGTNNRGVRQYKCQCVCGLKKSVGAPNLGVVTGCGCVRKEYKKHQPSVTKKAKQPVKKKPHQGKPIVIRKEGAPPSKPHELSDSERKRARILKRIDEERERIALERELAQYDLAGGI
ncbi:MULTISPECIES: hypothetical protein [Pseudoalteromonas]|uniref:hypothetical protein n=1 Tax=Pseudoalteromonas TaxID=53246 RepID=UPI00110AC81B|nr:MULTISPECIES: hypothetical protein [Pseudoalteromonas]MCG7545353.1 hypothetical protein [Pseudoalteromonas sp. MM17-2]TMO87631.1 hypothetical protein CWC12_10140 [Pseudoalteromonas ruthenica]TMP22292.1 hypothetical protein CWC06_15870 [Pseudoalteromonas ruthenica]